VLLRASTITPCDLTSASANSRSLRWSIPSMVRSWQADRVREGSPGVTAPPAARPRGVRQSPFRLLEPGTPPEAPGRQRLDPLERRRILTALFAGKSDRATQLDIEPVKERALLVRHLNSCLPARKERTSEPRAWIIPKSWRAVGLRPSEASSEV
jgi:hypothetical protein